MRDQPTPVVVCDLRLLADILLEAGRRLPIYREVLAAEAHQDVPGRRDRHGHIHHFIAWIRLRTALTADDRLGSVLVSPSPGPFTSDRGRMFALVRGG
jgi:hypothetical protein